MHYDILDKKRLDILPLLGNFKADFYLAGGTALALQIGHRDSIDFDFFCKEDFDTEKLFSKVEQVFAGRKILKTQEEKNTLTIFVDENIKISFFAYKYELLEPLIEEENLRLASIIDIACMKFSAITSRSSNKDYIDLYFILQKHDLRGLLEKCAKKFPALDSVLIIKSLLFYEDIENEPINFIKGEEVDFEMVKKFLDDQASAIVF